MALANYRRNVLLLATAQGLFLISGVIMITFSGLVGYMLADNKTLATVPVALYVIGGMVTTVPASLVMRRIGRRAGLMFGTTMGIVSGLLAAYAMIENNFWMFGAATFIGGIYQAHTQYYRFAAVDVAPREFTNRAISYVMAGGVAAALIGPWIAVTSRDLLAPHAFAGAFVVSAGVSVVALGVVSMLSLPRAAEETHSEPARPLSEIVVQPVFIAAALSAAMAYGLMVLIMTATPLAMDHHGHSIEATGGVIQGHVLAMFVPSFFSGWLISRFGVFKVLYAGMGLFALSGAIAVSGLDFENFLIALILLGVGWNFLFVGGTSLLTHAYRPSEKAKVQGLNELIVSIAAATGSFSSGALMNISGWDYVNSGMAPFLLITLLATLWYARSLRLAELASLKDNQ
ncbi:MAG: MFS transporter [Rhodospirillaceae bacterium]|nr:MFS transporter [Rhodospirillaceae bacterium]